MALIHCPECNREVSDQAYMCPGCGFPITATNTVTKQKQQGKNKSKRKRLPNGFGSITERKEKNLRKPFFVRVTVGKNAAGKPILKSLKPEAYFSTYEEAFAALVEYHKNPYDLEPDITVSQLYDQWSDTYFKTLESLSSTRTITAAWAYCSSIYNMRAKDVRARHIKGCMEDGYVIIDRGDQKGKKRYASAGTKSRIKSLFNLMLDYALEYEIVSTNYARTFELSRNIIKELDEARVEHIRFTDKELDILWKNVGIIDYVDIVLIQSYSGWRPQELGLIELKNVNLDDMTFTGGMKTKAGKSRLIPIHPKIQPLVQKRYKEALSLGSDYLLNCTDAQKGGYKLTYDKYANRFLKIISALELDSRHRAHDPRKTFVSLAQESGMNEHVLKALVGHSDNDVTEKIYTERSLENLRTELEKIK